jgi:hypothetical protein
MTLITRKRAASCTDSELHSLLRKLFNELASGRLDGKTKRKLRTAQKLVMAELASRKPS